MCLNADGWESLMKMLLENGEMTYVIGSQPSEGSMGKECKGDTKIQVESDIETSILGQEGREKIMAVDGRSLLGMERGS